jgi:hypothetical protein
MENETSMARATGGRSGKLLLENLAERSHVGMLVFDGTIAKVSTRTG